MKDLSEKQRKFIEKLLSLDELNDDENTFTFGKTTYPAVEVREWLTEIINDGEYTTEETEFLTGMGLFYKQVKE